MRPRLQTQRSVHRVEPASRWDTRPRRSARPQATSRRRPASYELACSDPGLRRNEAARPRRSLGLARSPPKWTANAAHTISSCVRPPTASPKVIRPTPSWQVVVPPRRALLSSAVTACKPSDAHLKPGCTPLGFEGRGDNPGHNRSGHHEDAHVRCTPLALRLHHRRWKRGSRSKVHGSKSNTAPSVTTVVRPRSIITTS